MLQLGGRRAPVTDLLASCKRATSTPLDNDVDSDDIPVYIPVSVDPDVDSGISGSPPAILDNWLQLQRALMLESVNNPGKHPIA